MYHASDLKSVFALYIHWTVLRFDRLEQLCAKMLIYLNNYFIHCRKEESLSSVYSEGR